jgi:methyl-accepting chemotaxis protein
MGEYKRIGKGGREVWIKASYNPVTTSGGKVLKIVKQATDITAEKLRNAELAAKLDALSRSQGTIEFKPDGEIITANDNFLSVIGYRAEEIVGRKHKIFVEASYGASTAYEEFWRRLRNGDFIADEFMRIGKDGKPVWIQASYNPIFDLNGKVSKVVKFAVDVTDRVKAVNEIAAGLTRLAENDFAQPITVAFAPTFERLRTDYNAAVEQVRKALLEISHKSDSIASGTREILSASDDMARRTEQQAANLEETAAALNEVTAAAKQTAENARHMQDVCASADETGRTSTEIVRDAVAAMDKISKSSQEISQIIAMIDEIAFQTNLLALNAGVEAARAGEAGRGFAVVASEVRGLAQRSAEAAKSIKTLIQQSTSQVQQGSKLVTETGKTLQTIIGQLSEINGAVAAIAHSAAEQAGSLAEINGAATQLDQTTQQNAAMVEELTAASHSLASDAEVMDKLVGGFKLTQGERGDKVSDKARTKSRNRAQENAGQTDPKAASKQRPLSKKVVNGGDWDDF